MATFRAWAIALPCLLGLAVIATSPADARRRAPVDQDQSQDDDAAEARRERQREAREARRERQAERAHEAREERTSERRQRGRNRDSGYSGGATTAEGCLPGVLKQRLAEVRQRFGSISVVSTHRPGARIAGTGKPSYHGSCRAVDFVPPSGKYSAVTKFLYAVHEGGVGTYTCMNHIHIDNGPNVRWSKCR